MAQRNNGLRKICGCRRAAWPKCPHAWHFNFKPRRGRAFRFSLDAELGRHLDSKTAAESEAARIKAEILAGVFVRAADRCASRCVLPAAEAVTLTIFVDRYIERFAKVCGKKTWTNDVHMLNQLRRFPQANGVMLGDISLAAITEDDLEAFFAHLRVKGRAASTCNQYAQIMKSAFRWATKKGYLARNPITEDSALERRKVAQRARRLAPDVFDAKGQLQRAGEERRLLASAGPGLQRLIIAALETACRRGELLSLQWSDVDLARGWLTIRAERAKDGEQRELPISVRLAAVLEMARTDPRGKDYPAEAYVFGELGGRTRSVKRAWDTCVLKAHGYTPEWKDSSLSPTSRLRLRSIDLHFHDLRHEAGSRFIEAGWPVHHVKEMLGHASLEQTDTYLNTTKHGLQESMRKSDANGKLCKPVASEGQIDHPTPCNDTPQDPAQPLLN